MEAVALYLKKKAPPPAQLVLARNCQSWNVMPDAGGYHDQKSRLMHEMITCMNTYNTIIKTKQARGSAIHNLSRAERDLLKPLVQKGLV